MLNLRDGRLIEMWKEKKSIEFFPTVKKSSTTEMWNIISNQKAFMKFV